MSDAAKPTEAVPTYVEFQIERGNAFRVIHVDGASGGSTPHGMIALTVYNERSRAATMARRPVIPAEGGFVLGSEETVAGGDGVFRELEATLIMDPPTAEQLRDLLIKVCERHAEARTDEDV